MTALAAPGTDLTAKVASSAALREVWQAAAQTILSRPGQEELAAQFTAAQYAEHNCAGILGLLAASASLRRAVRDRVALALPATLNEDSSLEDLAAGLTHDSSHAKASALLLSATSVLVAPAVVAEPLPAAVGTAAAGSKRKEGRSALEKQLRYSEANLKGTKAQSLQDKGKRDQAILDRDAARAQLLVTQSDLAEAQGQLDAALSNVAAAKRIAADIVVAARLLLAAADPVPVVADDDPRVAEQMLLSGQVAVPLLDEPADPRIAVALAEAGLSLPLWRNMLQALVSPTPPIIFAGDQALTRQREFVVTPLGGGEEIGGSCILVEVGDVRILVDAGMRPKHRISDAGPPEIAQALAGRIDAIVITHAHNDHAGYVPAVFAAQPGLKIFATSATATLLATMWNDSVSVFSHKTNAAAAAAGNEFDNPAPYTQADWKAARAAVTTMDFGQKLTLRTGVTLELFPAGHILGAAGVVITADDRKVTVTGDVSDLAQESVTGLIVPQAAVGSDLLVIESTYCKHGKTSRANEVDGFMSTIRDTVNGGGRVLIPAFALGRAQEVALLLRAHLPELPVRIDGLARAVSDVYESESAGTDRPLKIFGENVERVHAVSRDETIRSFRRGIIVTTSGMLSAGPAVPWAKAVLPDPKSALLIAGYQDEESPGAELLDLEARSRRERTLDVGGTPVGVQAAVSKFTLSAHADRVGLLRIVREVSPQAVMLVHGYPGPQRDFRDALKACGHHAIRTGIWAH